VIPSAGNSEAHSSVDRLRDRLIETSGQWLIVRVDAINHSPNPVKGKIAFLTRPDCGFLSRGRSAEPVSSGWIDA
jgi:hypothetical protein